jgi:hypothetical protein
MKEAFILSFDTFTVHFRKDSEFATHIKNNNRNLYKEIKKGYQSRVDFVNDENVCLQIPTTFRIGTRITFQLVNVYRISDVWQIETQHRVEPLVPDANPLEVEIAVEKLEKCKSSGSDQIQAGGEILWGLRFINSLIVFDIRKNCLVVEGVIIVPIYKKGDVTGNYSGISLLSTLHNMLSNILHSRRSR